MSSHRPVRHAIAEFVRGTSRSAPAQGPQVRDAIDLKRVMATVVVALVPCIVFAFGRYGVRQMLPLFVVSYGVGLGVEWAFALIRRTHIHEGYFVTGALIPLIVPVTIPLWQLAVGVAFAVIFAKEAFGGTGHNIFNPALVCRAFLFFAYPAQLTGAVWQPPPPPPAVTTPAQAEDAAPPRRELSPASVDALSSATPLALADSASPGQTHAMLESAGYTTSAMVSGDIPGSPGELNKIAIALGALLLLFTGIASARVILGGVLGLLASAALASFFASNPAGLFALAPWEHLLMGGFLFGVVFMATDPVTHPETNAGKWIFGWLFGALTILIRLYNPAYIEGTMLALLLMNAFSPALDRVVLAVHIRQRRRRRGE